ncbi:hypothetical protein KPH14_008370 [Odynerus spinipes]|uniref:Lymphoid-specific helicase-like n=1 Tax=Odynerus spinipes TaxID=1348599 RepID=A0AAD9VU18_9HYME|nr:hypothetical protein KPH14_008370 [Odynerus spinipes]
MELEGDKVLITKNIGNSKDLDVNNVVGHEFPSITGDFTSNDKPTNAIADHVEINNSVFENDDKKERKRRRPTEEELEQKRIEQEEYDRQLHEQRYKRLMHLLNRSQFYADFLMKKISQPLPQKTKAKGNGKKVAFVVDENVPPVKKGKKKNVQEYDIRQYISPKTEKRINSGKSNKLNLSDEDITKELLTFDEETAVNECKDSDVPKYFNGTLYEYQREGLQWLKVLYENGLNGILADEMGLGKTVQIIALLCHLIEKRQDGPYLLIVPLSTIPNWMSEFERFAPTLPVILFHGPKGERFNLSKKIKQFHHIVGGYSTQPIVLTTFEIPLLEINFLKNQKWRYIIIDEGHRIKNHQCELVKILRSLQSMNRLLLTGTPLQNNLAELWSLLNFLLPEIFDDLAVFESWFDLKELQHMEGTEKILKQEEEKHIISSLREILKPFILRREKLDVHINLPPKKEIIVYAPLTHLQHDLYKAVLNYDIHSTIVEEPIVETTYGGRPKRRCVLKNSTNINDSLNDQLTLPISDNNNDNLDSVSWKSTETKGQRDLRIWEQHINVNDQNRDYLIRLMKNSYGRTWLIYKKIVNHPYLIYNPLDFLSRDNDDIIKSSGKLMVMDAMLKELKNRGHKVLLFSTWTKILDIIEDYLTLRDYNYVRLDGQTNIEERSRNMQRFNTDPEVFLFLISTKAGGVGLNLAAADTVIMYDSDWNPQVDLQAMARCHRIGQTRPVVIYKLCTKGTVDEAILQRADAKRMLEKMVISKEFRKLSKLGKDTLVELKQLLESKESKIATCTNEVFTEAELNELLDRRDMV